MNDLFARHDPTGVAEAIRRGEVSAVEAVELALRRIEERNPAINPVIGHRGDEALEEVKCQSPTGRLAACRSW